MPLDYLGLTSQPFSVEQCDEPHWQHESVRNLDKSRFQTPKKVWSGFQTLLSPIMPPMPSLGEFVPETRQLFVQILDKPGFCTSGFQTSTALKKKFKTKMLPSLAKGVVNVAFSEAMIPSQRVADVTL